MYETANSYNNCDLPWNGIHVLYGSQMSKPIPSLIQSAIATLMVIFSVLAARGNKKAGEEK